MHPYYRHNYHRPWEWLVFSGTYYFLFKVSNRSQGDPSEIPGPKEHTVFTLNPRRPSWPCPIQDGARNRSEDSIRTTVLLTDRQLGFSKVPLSMNDLLTPKPKRASIINTQEIIYKYDNTRSK